MPTQPFAQQFILKSKFKWIFFFILGLGSVSAGRQSTRFNYPEDSRGKSAYIFVHIQQCIWYPQYGYTQWDVSVGASSCPLYYQQNDH